MEGWGQDRNHRPGRQAGPVSEGSPIPHHRSRRSPGPRLRQRARHPVRPADAGSLRSGHLRRQLYEGRADGGRAAGGRAVRRRVSRCRDRGQAQDRRCQRRARRYPSGGGGPPDRPGRPGESALRLGAAGGSEGRGPQAHPRQAHGDAGRRIHRHHPVGFQAGGGSGRPPHGGRDLLADRNDTGESAAVPAGERGEYACVAGTAGSGPAGRVRLSGGRRGVCPGRSHRSAIRQDHDRSRSV